MTPPAQDGCLTAACREIERACALLETPTAAQLDASAAALSRAIDCLRGRMEISEVEAPGSAFRLRHAVNRAMTLLRCANEYHSCWSRILHSMAANYTPYGVAEPLRLAPRFTGEG